MIKKITVSLVLISALFFAVAQTQPIIDYCKSTTTKKKCKKALSPYKYDASKLTRITLKNKPQMKELEIPLYFGEKYRFVFGTEGLPQPIDINIYNKKFEAKKRSLLWSSKQFPKSQKVFTWEPKSSKKLYITYDIPVTKDSLKKGCVVFLLGYAEK